jgi:hypothetical protein
MDSPKKQFLNADEIEANPEILRHPGAPEKRRNRSGQAAGVSKMHWDEPFAPRKISMLDSPAFQVLSLSARKIIDRLEIEFGRRKGNPLANGDLACTFEDFSAYGITRQAIAPAIREVVALGFVRITRKGSAGNEKYRQPTLYLLTYRHAGSEARLEDSWKRIQTLEQAEAIAKAARSAKADPLASELGRRGGRARWAKAALGIVSIPEKIKAQ